MTPYTVYLCGPINGRTDADAMNWREAIKRMIERGESDNYPDERPLAELGVRTLDPMRRDYRGRENEPGIADEIVELDLLDVARVDALIVYYDKPSVGTSMEVFHAWRQGKFVVLVDHSGRPLSPWLAYHTHRVVPSLWDAVRELRVRVEDFA